MNIGTIVEFFESMVKSSPMTPNNGILKQSYFFVAK